MKTINKFSSSVTDIMVVGMMTSFMNVPATLTKMWRFTIALLTLFAFGLGTHSLADDYVGLTVENDGHYYAKVPASSDWEIAREEAASLTYRFIDEVGQEHVYPGHLAVITNQRERDSIMTLGTTYNRAWTGGICDPVKNVWSWITEEEWIYTSWVTANDEAGQCVEGQTIAHINWACSYYYRWIGWESIWPDSAGGIISSIVEFEPPTLTCIGFESPMDLDSVKVEKKRALPLKAQLLDVDGVPLTDVSLAKPPVLQVIYTQKNIDEAAVDVTQDVLGAGRRTPGNQFTYKDGKWLYNMKTDNYTAPGTYILKMVAGDGQTIRPTCEATFIVE